jgi:hypothetical protein
LAYWLWWLILIVNLTELKVVWKISEACCWVYLWGYFQRRWYGVSKLSREDLFWIWVALANRLGAGWTKSAKEGEDLTLTEQTLEASWVVVFFYCCNCWTPDYRLLSLWIGTCARGPQGALRPLRGLNHWPLILRLLDPWTEYLSISLAFKSANSHCGTFQPLIIWVNLIIPSYLCSIASVSLENPD